MADYPLVDGLTQTADQSEPLHLRLAEFLAQRPGASGDDVVAAIGSLERAFKHEGDERVRGRLAAAISLLRDDDGYESKKDRK